MKNRVFFPQAALDDWIASDRVDLNNDELLIKTEGRRYKIIEAIRVLREVTGSADIHEVLGRVKTRAFLRELGAEILEGSMIIGDNAYDVIPGFIGAPVGTFAEHRKAAPAATATNSSLTTDEELLAAFLTSDM
ncbi:MULTISPECIES: hypothetical protein [Sorangium]|uniref:Uncharacterized protein n=1 Tax=Sorangium cellulosum TaxID=56 RepID=A0A150RK82_SORCE|nr:hypothetical protein [Sorangium cellulosum]KYF68275.1 hypothetical protein BE15_10810 [Sorangium cellulosum]KYF80632.1 hypothetical protein BE11_30155 [Sorangium cellulosum]